MSLIHIPISPRLATNTHGGNKIHASTHRHRRPKRILAKRSKTGPESLGRARGDQQRAEEARREGRPIAWVRHHNRPNESAAFIPNTWGAEYSTGLGPKPACDLEAEFLKEVYGAFTGSNIGAWLKSLVVEEVLIVGFYTHGCVSTTSREAIMLGLDVSIDPNGTGTCSLSHELLGALTADEARRSALLQLANMGAKITPLGSETTADLEHGTAHASSVLV